MEVKGSKNDVKKVRLYDVVNRLPSDMKADEFYRLVGTRTAFTEQEADEIVENCLAIRLPEMNTKDADPIDKLVDNVVSPVKQKDEVPPSAPAHYRDPDKFCRGLLVKNACNASIENKGVVGSGFCDSCWYPDIVEDYATYREHRQEGYNRNEALQMAGIQPRSEKKERIPTYAARKTGKRTDDNQ